MHTFGTSTTDAASSSSSSTSTSVGTSSSSSSSSSTSTSTTRTSPSTTTRGTTPYVPPQTESTIPYIIRQTIPPYPSTPEHDIDNDIYHPDGNSEDYDNYGGRNGIPEPPVPEPETEPPPIFRTPPPIFPNPGVYNNINPTRIPKNTNKHNRINSEAEERTAMIIGIVAGALIAVILVILLVLWIKSNGDRSYKMEHDLKYGHGANAALLGHNAGHSNNQQHGGASLHGAAGGHHNNNGQQQQHHNQQQYGNGNGYNGGQNYDAHGNVGGHHSSNMGLNGSLRQHGSQHSDRNGMSAGLVQPKAKRNSKDIKEWYV